MLCLAGIGTGRSSINRWNLTVWYSRNSGANWTAFHKAEQGLNETEARGVHTAYSSLLPLNSTHTALIYVSTHAIILGSIKRRDVFFERLLVVAGTRPHGIPRWRWGVRHHPLAGREVPELVHFGGPNARHVSTRGIAAETADPCGTHETISLACWSRG